MPLSVPFVNPGQIIIITKEYHMAVIEISCYKRYGALIRRMGIPCRSIVSQNYIAIAPTMPTGHYIEHFLEPLLQKQYT